MKKLVAKPRQLELGLKPKVSDLQFFKMFSAAIVHHNLIAKLGASAFATFVAMRANSRVSDGRIYIGIRELSQQTGLAENTTRSSIKKLIGLGYVEHKAEAANKKKCYYTIDYFYFRSVQANETVTDALDEVHAGNAEGIVKVRYNPTANRDDLDQMQAYLRGGRAPVSAQMQVMLLDKQFVGQQNVQTQFVAHQTTIIKADVVVVTPDGLTVQDRWQEGKNHARAIRENLENSPSDD